ncbi:MAG TPA: hypothetical protein VNW97_17955 [Candidatus Saccharimonadales bacterium]|jgi:hypothetical protein|nr:hypothetical protein [Candidatus Saccharimonadales bacterium]
MAFYFRQSGRALFTCLLITLFAVPTQLLAQSHVVNPADLQQEMVSAAQARQQNLKTVQNFLSTPTAEKALKSAKMDAQSIQTAVSSLNDEELSQLSTRAARAQADFAAGKLSDRDLILIILAIAALVLIIVAVR